MKFVSALLIISWLCAVHQAAEPPPAALPQSWRASGIFLAEQFAAEMPQFFEESLLGEECKAWATDYFERFVLASARPYLRQWQAAWSKAEKIELHSLSNVSNGKLPKLRKYYSVVGTATITEPAEIAQLATLLPALVCEGDNPNQIRAACFSPHHGLSLTVGKEKHDFIICFACNTTKIYSEKLPGGEQQVEYLTKEQQTMVDQILQKHNTPTSYQYEVDQLKLQQEQKALQQLEHQKNQSQK